MVNGEEYQQKEITVVKEPVDFELALQIYHELPEEEAKIAALIQSKSGTLSAEQKSKVDVYFAGVKKNSTIEEEASLRIQVSLQEINVHHSPEERRKILENTFEILKNKTTMLVGVEGDYVGKARSKGNIVVSSVHYEGPQSIYKKWLELADTGRDTAIETAKGLKGIFSDEEIRERIKKAEERYETFFQKAQTEYQKLLESEGNRTEEEVKALAGAAVPVKGKDSRKGLPEPQADLDPAPSASLAPVVVASVSPKETKESEKLRKGPVINKTEKRIEFTFQSRQQRKEYLAALRQEFKDQNIKEGDDEDRYQMVPDDNSEFIVRIEASQAILDKIKPLLLVLVQDSSKKKPCSASSPDSQLSSSFQISPFFIKR